jgi:hypothetical protein
MHEPVRVKLKTQWRYEEVRNAKNVECLSRNIAGNKWSQPKRWTIWVTTSKDSKLVGTHCMIPLALGTAGLNICPSRFSVDMVPCLLSFILPFWNGNI